MVRTKKASPHGAPQQRPLQGPGAKREFTPSLKGPEAQREFKRQFLALGGQPDNLKGWIARCINKEGMGCFYPPRPEAVGYHCKRFRNVTAVARYLLTDYDPFEEKGTSKAVAPARLAWKWKAIQII